MKNHLIIGITALLGLSFYSCGQQAKEKKDTSETGVLQEKSAQADPAAKLQKQAVLLFGTLPEVAENADNPVTPEKVQLGKALYFDTRLSKDNKVSCNSCHDINQHGVDHLSFSIGNDGHPGARNSPTVLNAALEFRQFWDGRAKDVEEQAGGPILNPVEMAIPNKEFLVKRLQKIPEYKTLFSKVFPEDKNPVTFENIQKAIAAYERKLIIPSKFDAFMKSDLTALNAQEQEGLQTFIKTGCVTCHSGNTLGGKMFQKFGVYHNYWEYTGSKKIDEGRYDVTKNETDKYFFKVPSLRNVAETYPYFQDGSVANLNDAVRIMAKTQLNKDLSEKQIKDIVAFLHTLTGEVPNDLRKPLTTAER